MIEVVRPARDEKVYDPACGSGGFLIMNLRKQREWIKKSNPNLDPSELKSEIKYIAEHYCFGTDFNDRMVRVSKMNMIMHGDGHSGIFQTNGLLTDPDLPDRLKDEVVKTGVEVILSNPPFAGTEKDPTILSQFELGKNKDGDPKSVSKEVLFIEKIIALLTPGGRAGLLLPSGVFNNKSMEAVRDHIRKKAKILALVGLPHLTFQVSGANNEGHLLFIEKVEKIPEDYNIFIDWATDVGIDVIGKKTGKNDLFEVLDRYHNPPKRNIIKFSELGDRIDPWYYHPNYQRIRRELSSSGQPWLTLGEIFKPSSDRINLEEYRDKEIMYVEKENVDMEKGIIHSHSVHTLSTLPSWATFVLKEGDVLFSRAYDSMRGVAIVSKENEGFVASGGLIVVRHNPDRIRLNYVRRHFTMPEILFLIKRQCTGEINPKFTWPVFSKTEIPLPSLEEQDRILSKIKEIETRKQRLTQELSRLDWEADQEVRTAIPEVVANYEAIKIKRAEFIGQIEFKVRPDR